MNEQIQTIKKEINPLIKTAIEIKISNGSDLRNASELLSNLNKARDRAKKQMDTIIKPARESIKATQAVWNPFITKATEAIGALRSAISAFQTAQIALEREKEAKLVARVQKGTLRAETAILKLEENKTPEKITTQAGMIKFREEKRFTVVDLAKLPLEYHLPNESLIRQALKNGTELPGVEYRIEQIPLNFR